MLLPIVRMLVAGTWSGVWPLLMLPALAAAIADLVARRVDCGDPLWQRRAMLGALCAPGFVFMALTLVAIAGFERFPAQTWRCVVTMYGGVIAALLVSSRATARHLRRLHGIGRLRRLAGPLGPRLAEAAVRCNVPVEQIETDRPLCALVGVYRPRVLISSGAVDRLSDDELHAALVHERAHMRMREVFWEALVAVSADCSLFRGRYARALYRRCREFVADDVATAEVAAVDLASALLACVRSATVPLGVGFAGETDVRLRIARLLDADRRPTSRGRRWAAVAFVAAGSLALVPLVTHLIAARLCHGG